MNGIVQISCLGSMGRFGNQLFQYACARGYAESVGAKLETPPWVGQTLFGLNDAPISTVVPRLQLDYVPKNGEVNVNLNGYFQHAECFKLYTLSKLREWFTFTPYWIEKLNWIVPWPLATHVRRGDYVSTYSGSFCIIDEEAYLTAIRNAGFPTEASHWVREDAPTPFPLAGLEFLPDFVQLMRSETLFRANSTFSWWAATLGNNRVFSPLVEGLRGHQKAVPFIEANWPRCTDQPNVSDYHIAP